MRFDRFFAKATIAVGFHIVEGHAVICRQQRRPSQMKLLSQEEGRMVSIGADGTTINCQRYRLAESQWWYDTDGPGNNKGLVYVVLISCSVGFKNSSRKRGKAYLDRRYRVRNGYAPPTQKNCGNAIFFGVLYVR